MNKGRIHHIYTHKCCEIWNKTNFRLELSGFSHPVFISPCYLCIHINSHEKCTLFKEHTKPELSTSLSMSS